MMVQLYVFLGNVTLRAMLSLPLCSPSVVNPWKSVYPPLLCFCPSQCLAKFCPALKASLCVPVCPFLSCLAL
ncbi:hypothetical protein DSO57_1012217 [Entomophthora muscae]|uniref:Uncharacterized protein n=1 Tax=Entomophthora muscae TaxID=34485 RepID=A0ACC2USP1_9FUNG|nr:hypothetical protein DSO57_1012217 [Entomophthora muscae]